MGSNRRYGDKAIDAILNRALTRPKPISLSEKEIGVAVADVTEAPEPVRVAAWVRYPESPVQVEARAVAWTDRAVWVEFVSPDGATLRTWVWRGAVSRL